MEPPTLFALACLSVSRKYTKGVVNGHRSLENVLPPSLLPQVLDCVDFSVDELLHVYCIGPLQALQYRSLRWRHNLQTILLPSEARRSDTATLALRKECGVPQYKTTRFSHFFLFLKLFATAEGGTLVCLGNSTGHVNCDPGVTAAAATPPCPPRRSSCSPYSHWG